MTDRHKGEYTDRPTFETGKPDGHLRYDPTDDRPESLVQPQRGLTGDDLLGRRYRTKGFELQ